MLYKHAEWLIPDTLRVTPTACTRTHTMVPGPVDFTEDHLTLGKVAHFPRPSGYEPQLAGVYSTGANVHRGQDKLLVSEVQFLARAHAERACAFPGVAVDSPFLCVYAGACPCLHLHELLRMFPNVVFVLVDPAFEAAGLVAGQPTWDPGRVVVWPEEFDAQGVDILVSWLQRRAIRSGTHHMRSVPPRHLPYFERLGQLRLVDFEAREDVLFISDIRVHPLDEDRIARDMDLQALWFHQLQASSGLLKFRLPYVTDGWLAQSGEHGGERWYLEGEVYLPVWGPRSTTECRLRVERGCGVCAYDPVSHERRLAGFNRYERQGTFRWKGADFESFDAAATAAVATQYQEHVQMVADCCARLPTAHGAPEPGLAPPPPP